MPWLVGIDDWLVASYGTEQRKIELDPISTEERLRQLFADYGCNGTEFSYVIFTEQRNFTTAKRRNGNGRTATEWWKPGITLCCLAHICSHKTTAENPIPRCT